MIDGNTGHASAAVAYLVSGFQISYLNSPPSVRPVPARGMEARKRNPSITSIPTPVCTLHVPVCNPVKCPSPPSLIELSKGKGGRSTPRDTISDWEDYHSYDQITGYIDEVAATYDFCTAEVIGQSVEGRDLKVLKMERAGPGAKNVFIEASKSCYE